MKMLLKIVILIGTGFIITAYATSLVSKQYVDQTFFAIEQTYANLQQQINDLTF